MSSLFRLRSTNSYRNEGRDEQSAVAMSSIGLTICSDKPLLRGERGAKHDGYMFLGYRNNNKTLICGLRVLTAVLGCKGLQRGKQGEVIGELDLPMTAWTCLDLFRTSSN